MTYEIPYKQLELLGLPRQAVDAMPESLKQSLTSGELTPLINVKFKENSEMRWLFPIKLRIQEDVMGREQLAVYPMNREMVNSANLSNADFRELQSGEVIKANGKFFQRDPETNCILEKHESQLDIERKIAEIEKLRDIELGTQQKEQIREGKPVELEVGGEKITVGIDLRDKDHFMTLKGDMMEWQRQKEIDYDILHPEYVGIVQTDENRWEQQMIRREGLNSQTLKEHRAQTRSSGMRL